MCLCSAVVGASTRLTNAALHIDQTFKYVANQIELLGAIGHNTTAILTANIFLEYSELIADSETGIVIEDVRGFVIDGAGFTIDGGSNKRCIFVSGGPSIATTVTFKDLTVTNGRANVGGGIFVGAGATATLTASPVTGNTATVSSK